MSRYYEGKSCHTHMSSGKESIYTQVSQNRLLWKGVDLHTSGFLERVMLLIYGLLERVMLLIYGFLERVMLLIYGLLTWIVSHTYESLERVMLQIYDLLVIYVFFATYLAHMNHPHRIPSHVAATHCNTLQHAATCYMLARELAHSEAFHTESCRCNTPQRTATHCNTLQHTATHCNTLQHTAIDCNTLQHTATHCNILHFCARISPICIQ